MLQLVVLRFISFGGDINKYPHPEADFASFIAFVGAENKRVPHVWSPVDKANREWINIKNLQKLNPSGGGCVLC